MEEIKLELTVNESETARFEVTYIVDTGVAVDQSEQTSIPHTIVYLGYKKRIRLMFFNRLDKYQGTCELMAREVDVDPEKCICHSVEVLRSRTPAFVKYIEEKYNK
jgi:hypothetical protein